MKLVSLSDPHNTLADAPRSSIITTVKAPHFSALKDPKVAGDITAATFGVPGMAMGAPGTFTTNMGVFTDKWGNQLVVAVESTESFQVAWDKKLFAPDVDVWRIERYMGGGWGELTAEELLMGTGKLPKRSAVRAGSTYPNLHNAIDVFSAVEMSGKNNHTTVFLLSGKPITLKDLVGAVLTLVLAGAKIIASTIGIPASYIETITPILLKLSRGEMVTLNDIIGVARLIAPADVRTYVDKAGKIAQSAQKNDYLSVANELGINVKVATAFVQNALTDIASVSKLGFDKANKVVQNLLNIDTINRFRRGLDAGSIFTDIIAKGSIVDVTAVQNWLVAQQGGTIASAVPKIADFVSTVVNKTNDVTSASDLRAWLATAFGQPTNGDAFDALTIRALTQRAITGLETGVKQFVMPVSIPLEKRVVMGSEVARQTGIPVVVPGIRSVFY